MLLQEILLVRLFPMQRMFARDVLDVTVRTVFLALHMCSSQTPPPFYAFTSCPATSCRGGGLTRAHHLRHKRSFALGPSEPTAEPPSAPGRWSQLKKRASALDINWIN